MNVCALFGYMFWIAIGLFLGWLERGFLIINPLGIVLPAIWLLAVMAEAGLGL